MGSPGKMWKEELTRKKVPSWKVTDGSGAKPGMMGFEYLVLMLIFTVTRPDLVFLAICFRWEIDDGCDSFKLNLK
jgi:hypothetical protein